MAARTYRDICAEAVITIEVAGGMTEGRQGNFLSSRAEGMRREIAKADVSAEDEAEALAKALDRISSLEGEIERLKGLLVAREETIAHLHQSAEILREQVDEAEARVEYAVAASEDVAVMPDEPQALPVIEQEGPAPAQIASGSGRAGNSVKSPAPRIFRLYEVENGEDTGYVDEGTAGSLANRNDIGPSTIYSLARSGKVGIRFRVEEVA